MTAAARIRRSRAEARCHGGVLPNLGNQGGISAHAITAIYRVCQPADGGTNG